MQCISESGGTTFKEKEKEIAVAVVMTYCLFRYQVLVLNKLTCNKTVYCTCLVLSNASCVVRRHLYSLVDFNGDRQLKIAVALVNNNSSR